MIAESTKEAFLNDVCPTSSGGREGGKEVEREGRRWRGREGGGE